LAEKHLRDVVVVKPELSLLLAAVLKVQGDFIGARSWAERAAKFHREKVEAARLDDPENRLAWADALAMMEDYPGACLILESGWKQFGNGIYHAPLGEACSLWVQKLAVTAPGDLAFRIAIIQQGLEYAPQNEGLLKHLIALSHLEGQQAGAARSTLNRLLSEGKSTSILHFTLGIDAWQRQQTEEAKQHFAIAFDTAPKLPFVANNMAMILAVGNPPDPPRALDIIQPVVEKFPDNATFRDTRGQVLVLLGRWQEAVTDLEFALPQLSSPNRTHAALAEAYRGLGLKDLAAEHEQRAKGAPEGKGKVSPRQKS
jgi:tetratricopeptide (TPR) repeat protein